MNRQLSREEIQKILQRWHQLRNQFGEHAVNVPEFAHLSKIIKFLQQQNQQALQRQQQQQRQGGQYGAQEAQQIPHNGQVSNVPNPGIQHNPSINGMPPNKSVSPNMQVNIPKGQGIGGTPSNQPQGFPNNSNSAAAPSFLNNSQDGSAFTPQQFQLVKAQYQALKFLVKNPNSSGQPIPQNLIDFITNDRSAFPDGSYLPSVNGQFQQLHASPDIAPNKPGSPNFPMNNQSPATFQSIPQGPPLQSDPSFIAKGIRQQKNLKNESPNLPYRNSPSVRAPSVSSYQASKGKANTLEPVYMTPEPPVNIKDLIPNKEKNDKVILPINKPNVQVDCFEVPSISDDVDVAFSALYAPQSRFQFPFVLPETFHMENIRYNREITILLQIDQRLSSLKERLAEITDDESEKEELKSEIVKLELLPFQKTLRGKLLSHVWFGQSLLPNSHPNFLAKFNNLSLDGVHATRELYRHQLDSLVQEQNQKHHSSIRQILSSSEKRSFKFQRKKEKSERFFSKIASFHNHAAKEEQRKIERMAKQRLQALKSNDEEEYLKLLDHTKDTRITHLLKQTNQFLDSLARAVQNQQKEGRVEKDGNQLEPVISEDEKREKLDYYHIAHRIKEEVTKQPSILVGGTLKEYQIKGLQWMVSLFNNHLNGILADEMGLGKTIQTISLVTYLIEAKHIPGPFLVIVPLSTLTNWNLEFEKWAPSVKKITYKGTPNQRKVLQYDIKQGNFQILLTTFEYVIKDRNLLSKIKWVHMIIDEGHRMKNANSKLSETLTHHYHSDYRLILTGTPLQNNLPELWALLNFVLPKIFNSVKSFDEWFNTPFANTGGQDKIELSEEETLLVIRRLHKVLRPFLLRRLKKDVEKDLPSKVEKVVKCKMSALQSKLYQQMLKYNVLFASDPNNEDVPVMIKNANNQIMQLRKICNHPFVYEEVENLINPTVETNDQIWRVAGKFELLDRVLPKFKATGHRVLIFFQMTQIMDIMEDFLRLRGLKYMRLDGATKADDRTGLLKLFNAENSEYFCFLLSTRAGGLGLNLQTADTVIIFDTDWNPHQDLQAQDRAHRIGQKNEVRILRLITEDSVEEMILERAYAKLEIDGKVIQAGKFDNKSTAEEQEALLRALIEKEDERKQKGGYENDDDLDDDELNQVIARNDGEIEIFRNLDEARAKETRDASYPTRLFSEQELPSIYKRNPDDFLKRDEILQEYGRGSRERKVAMYDDNLTEEQWLKKIDGMLSDDSDDDSSRQKRSRGSRGKKAKISEYNSDDESTTQTEPGSRNSSKRKLMGDDYQSDSSSSKKQKSTTPAIRNRSQGRSRASKPFNRTTPSVDPLTSGERSSLQDIAEAIYESVMTYHDEDGRSLSDIFLVKPSKKLYPDYYVLIKHPIALDVVKKRINTNCYVHAKELLEDFHLMFSNAKVYNEEGSIVYQDAVTLENLVKEKFQELSSLDREQVEEALDFTEFDEKLGLNPVVSNNAIKQPLRTQTEDIDLSDSKSPSVGI